MSAAASAAPLLKNLLIPSTPSAPPNILSGLVTTLPTVFTIACGASDANFLNPPTRTFLKLSIFALKKFITATNGALSIEPSLILSAFAAIKPKEVIIFPKPNFNNNTILVPNNN